MKDFTVYKTATGIVEHVISSDCEVDDIIIESDETIVEGNYSPTKFRFVNGVPEEITLE